MTWLFKKYFQLIVFRDKFSNIPENFTNIFPTFRQKSYGYEKVVFPFTPLLCELFQDPTRVNVIHQNQILTRPGRRMKFVGVKLRERMGKPHPIIFQENVSKMSGEPCTCTRWTGEFQFRLSLYYPNNHWFYHYVSTRLRSYATGPVESFPNCFIHLISEKSNTWQIKHLTSPNISSSYISKLMERIAKTDSPTISMKTISWTLDISDYNYNMDITKVLIWNIGLTFIFWIWVTPVLAEYNGFKSQSRWQQEIIMSLHYNLNYFSEYLYNIK